MSILDGQMENERLYVVSDIALAAYLLMRGFELLGAIDSGKPRKDFGLTHTDPAIAADMEGYVRILADEYDNIYFPVPFKEGATVNFKLYNRKMRELKHALDEAVRR